MSDRILYFCFLTSFLIHVASISGALLWVHTTPPTPTYVPIELVNVPQVVEVEALEALPSPSTLKPKAMKTTTPKLLSKPEVTQTADVAPIGNIKEEIKEPRPPVEPKLTSPLPDPRSVKGGWNVEERPGQAGGATAGAGNLFGAGDVDVIDGGSRAGGDGGTGTTGLGLEAKGDGTGRGGGLGSGKAFSGLARPLSGYQVKPSYPESARRAGAQGTTLLKLHILENGKVGEVHIEQSAGNPDLDTAAADAVRKWLFEPARSGKQPIAVWVSVPVKFELQ